MPRTSHLFAFDVSASPLSAAAIAWLAVFVNETEYSAKVWQTKINFEHACIQENKLYNQPTWRVERDSFLPSKASNLSTSTLLNTYPKNPHGPSITGPQSSPSAACPPRHANLAPTLQRSQTPKFAARTTAFALARDKHVAAIRQTQGV